MSYETKENGETIFEHSTTKIGNKIIKESTNSFAGENALVNENGEVIPYDIEVIDQSKDIAYKLTHLDDIDAYIYTDRRTNAETEEDWDNIMCRNINLIKDFTLDIIPSDFKDLLIYSIHPLSQVSLNKREIYINQFGRNRIRIILTNDCLLENYIMEYEFNKTIELSASYNYVPEHFKDKKIEDPIEKYNLNVTNYPY